jgi:hypothetical protein
MMIRALIGILAVVVTFAGATEDSQAAGDSQKGSQVFRQCLACPVLQELGGWASAEMVRRYAHLSPGHLAHHANSVDLGGAEVVQLRVGVA